MLEATATKQSLYLLKAIHIHSSDFIHSIQKPFLGLLKILECTPLFTDISRPWKIKGQLVSAHHRPRIFSELIVQIIVTKKIKWLFQIYLLSCILLHYIAQCYVWIFYNKNIIYDDNYVVFTVGSEAFMLWSYAKININSIHRLCFKFRPIRCLGK